MAKLLMSQGRAASWKQQQELLKAEEQKVAEGRMGCPSRSAFALCDVIRPDSPGTSLAAALT